MNVNEFFKKVYTVAFRLTGDEMKAGDMAFIAIKCASSGLMLSDKVSDRMFQRAAEEVCRLFLSEADNNIQVFKRFELNNSKAELFQDALMTLNPKSRVAIMWKDVLGFPIDDMAEIKCTKQELYSELNFARRQMKEILSDMTLYETGA